MRKRFEQQLSLGVIPIQEVEVPLRSRDSISAMLAAIKEIFVRPEYNERVFHILEDCMLKGKQKTGRPGMNLWQIFVLAQFRLELDLSYDALHNLANNHKLLRQIMGVEKTFGYESYEIGYQSIIDNVTLLDDSTLKELNKVIVDFGHDVFKKKDMEELCCKTDSYVVESNVHFPTDYNLLWDCARKNLDTIKVFLEKYPEISGWRKLKNWRREIKSLMRELGKASSTGGKNKEVRIKQLARQYIKKSSILLQKLISSAENLTIKDTSDALTKISLDNYINLLSKHIDLVERRLIKGETIPHEEKLFSIFEQYTEWITKGKQRPNVELGKKLSITTDQYNLIIDYQIMENQSDSEIVIPLAKKLLKQYQISNWSFDKGYWHKYNKQFLKESIKSVIMPKKGKCNQEEKAEEREKSFVKLRNKHSAVESNINELEHRGLNRCPDKGYHGFKRYIGIGIIAYNIHKIGKAIILQKEQLLKKESRIKLCA